MQNWGVLVILCHKKIENFFKFQFLMHETKWCVCVGGGEGGGRVFDDEHNLPNSPHLGKSFHPRS